MQMFTYDQESAKRAGSTGFQTGAHTPLKIEQAEWRNYNGMASLNLSLVNSGGSKTFVDLTYKGADGKEWKGNVNHIQAIIGLVGAQGLTSVPGQPDGQGNATYVAPELAGKFIGAILQKELYTKGDGSEGNKMRLVMAFDHKTQQTLKEKLEQKQAATVDKICEDLEDKDNRKPQQGGQQQGGWGNQQQQQASQPMNQGGYSDVPVDYDDNIPF